MSHDTDNGMDYAPLTERQRVNPKSPLVTSIIARSQLEHFASLIYLEDFIAINPEALVPRVPWHDLPRKTRIKWRKRALTLLLEPIE